MEKDTLGKFKLIICGLVILILDKVNFRISNGSRDKDNDKWVNLFRRYKYFICVYI